MSKSLGNVVDPLDIIHGISLQVLRNYSPNRKYDFKYIIYLQSIEEKLNISLQRGHLSSEEFNKALEEKRSKFPDGITQTGADALRFTLCSYNVKSILFYRIIIFFPFNY